MVLVRKAVGIVLICMVLVCPLGTGEVLAAETEKNLRSMKYTSRTKDRAIAWQKELRSLAGNRLQRFKVFPIFKYALRMLK